MKNTTVPLILILLFTIGCSDQSNLPDQNASPQAGPSPSFENVDRIYEAALQGEIEKVRNYLDQGFDVNQVNQDKQSLLMLAGFNGHTELCKLLLKAGARINDRDANGRTPLMFASSGPFPETVQLLLESGADPNPVDHGEHFTALMHAAAEGHLEVVRVLLENGADKNMKDVDNDTAESFARQKGHIAVADFLKNYK